MGADAIKYLSLARKAGRIEVGEEPAGAAARAGHARLVLVAGDAPDSTRRRAKSFVAGTDQQMVILPFTKDEMGAALGRSVVALAAMTDPAMALAFLKALDDPDRYGDAIASLTVKAERMRRHQLEQKAHEKNLRTGKVHREKEADKPVKKQVETPTQGDKKARTEYPAGKARTEYPRRKTENTGKGRRDDRYDARDRGGKGKRTGKNTSDGKTGYRTEADSSRSGKWDGHRESGGKPFAKKAGYAAGAGGKQKTDYHKNSGKSAGQKYATGNKVAGRKPGRKTHGGAV